MQDVTTETPHPGLSSRQQAFATLAVMLTLLLVTLDQTVVGTAMPRIIADLNGLNVYAWVTTAYLVASTVVVPVAGKLGDMFGRKPFMLAGMAGFMAGSWLCGLAQNMPELIAFRAVQGMFGGMLFANTFTVLADVFADPRQRVRMQGLFGAVFGVSSVIGPTFGGYITDNWGWRWIFYVNVPVGILAVLVTLAALPYVRSKASWREIDFAGAAVLVAGVIPLLIGLSITNDHSWTSPEVLGLLAVAAVMLGVFFVIETRWAQQPVVPFEIFRNNQFAISVSVAFLAAVGMFGAIVFVPLIYQGVLGATATNSGNLLIPMMGGIVFFSTAAGRLMARIRRYRFLGTLGVADMIAAAWLLSTVTTSTSQWTVAAYTVLLGAGLGTTFPLTLTVVQVALPQRMVGVATSQVQFWRNLGGTVGTAVLGSILARQLTPAIGSRVAQVHLPPQLRLPSSSGGSPQAALDPARLAQARAALPSPAQTLFDQVVHAMRVGLADALHDVFLVAAATLVLALLATLCLREVPLRHARRAPEDGRQQVPEAAGALTGE